MNFKRMSAREILLFGIPLLVLAVPIYLKVKNSEVELRKVMVSLAGPRAVDCNSKGAQGPAYMRSAIKNGRPFFFSSSYHNPTTSANYVFGTVKNSKSEMFMVSWERAPWYSLSAGNLTCIVRVKNLKVLPNLEIVQSRGSTLTPSEQERLLKSATKTS